MNVHNQQVILKSRPFGLPQKEIWSFEEHPIPEPQEGQILIQQHYISLDPAMRGWLNETKSYIAPVQIGDVMRAGSVGQIIKSNNHPHWDNGDFVVGVGGVQQYVTTDGEGWHRVKNVDNNLVNFLGPLGMPGMTAYFGMLRIGDIKEGDTVLISGAAGAVGSIAGQIAKLKGCRVIGIAGGQKKCDYLKDELGFNGAIDYKNEDIKQSIKELCPQGIDVFFDNVGGDILDTTLIFINRHARIVICGAISQYNNTSAIKGPGNYLSLLVNRAKMEGMVVFDWANEYPEAIKDISLWMESGKIKSDFDIYEGIELFHETFLRLFSGDKLGKLLLKVL